jgi:hypothetical protein
MERAWRIEFKGALYPVLSSGGEGRAIFYHDDDHCKIFSLTYSSMSHIVRSAKSRMAQYVKLKSK